MVRLLSGNSVGKFWKTYRGTSLFFSSSGGTAENTLPFE